MELLTPLLLIVLGLYQIVSCEEVLIPEGPDIFCYTCGLPETDPELDQPGSFGDSRREWVPEGKKMYNYTCDIADKMGLAKEWIRKCPHGVRSCFWSETSYGNEVTIFRGCAPSFFPFKEKCQVELESVLTGTGSQRVAPRVELCFCNQNECNKEWSAEKYFNSAATKPNRFDYGLAFAILATKILY